MFMHLEIISQRIHQGLGNAVAIGGINFGNGGKVRIAIGH
jgi:hypothetical protein